MAAPNGFMLTAVLVAVLLSAIGCLAFTVVPSPPNSSSSTSSFNTSSPAKSPLRTSPASVYSSPSSFSYIRRHLSSPPTTSLAAATVMEDVQAVVVEQLSVEKDKVQPESNFIKDLGADSLDSVELVMALEEKFGVEIPDEEATNIKTVQQAVDYIEKHKKEVTAATK
eukprot:GHVS01025884.1.p1 GENE.GHVS01025884.1~~GHVS01025884.1.p1  ORF type:complete len:168 (+),score=64.42 GHVS01025884.1:120-623(+)